MRFKRKRSDAVVVEVDPFEAGLLTDLASDLLDLLAVDEDDEGTADGPGEGSTLDEGPADEGPADGSAAQLAALVGMPTGPVERPTDPALARLLPDAYADDDQAAAEFRRYTESDLRAAKQQDAGVVLATLAPLLGTGGRLHLDRDQVDAWLGTLNDLRLVLGTRLGVTEDTDLEPSADDQRATALQVYGWLGWLQESILARVDPRPAG